MKKIITSILGSILLSSVSFCEITITDAQVLSMEMEKVKGNWGAPGGKRINSMILKVKSWEQNKVDENDDFIIKVLESQETIEISQEKGLASNFANNDDYKFLKRHKSLFSNKVRPKINVTGRLIRHKSFGYNAKYINFLRNPTYTSRKGTITVPHYEKASAPTTSKLTSKTNKFDALYAEDTNKENPIQK
ncbi:MAG: hypothetical protein COB02_08060 [Candidatus Cloacimonadota bacterium]|nr:MAG: hypothetical protein COB02_08060 [Candidatus Cloacimonadota bacterium]